MSQANAQKGQIFPDVKKIAILNANGIDELLYAFPAFEAIRSAYPEAEVTLITRKPICDFLNGREGPINYYEECPVYPGINEGVYDADEADRFFRRMQREGFDLAFQMHGSGLDSNPFLLKLGAKHNFGTRQHQAEFLDYWIPLNKYESDVARNLEIASLAGAKITTNKPHLNVTKEDIDASYELAPKEIENIAILRPGAKDPRNKWSAKRFAEVGDYLSKRGMNIVIIGQSGSNPADVRAVKDWMKRPAIAVTSKITLSSLIGLISRATLFVGNDGSSRHLAEAIDIPNLGFYWVGKMITNSPSSGTLNRAVVSWNTTCPYCKAPLTRENTRAKRCIHKVSVFNDIEVEDVITQLNDLLTDSRVLAESRT